MSPLRMASLFSTVAAMLFLAPVALLHAAAPLSFADDIQPMLERTCLPCHNATKAEGGLQLETPKLMEKGGDSGSALKPNHALESELFLVASRLKKPYMPPDGNKSKALPLTSMQLEILRRWIDEGALGNPKPRQPIVWKEMPSGIQSISAVAVTPDGQFAACGRGGEVTVYNLPTQRSVAVLMAHPDIVGALAFSPDGTILATGSHGEVKLWRKIPSPPQKLPAPPPALDAAALTEIPELSKATVSIAVRSGADALIAAGGADGKVNLWNRAAKSIVRTIPAEGPVKLLATSPGGKFLAFAAEGHAARLVNMADGKTVADLKADRAGSEAAAAADLEVSGAAFELTFLQNELKQTQDRLGKLTEESVKADKEVADFASKRAAMQKAFDEARVKRDSLSKPRDEAEDALMAASVAHEAARTAEKEAQRAAAAAVASAAKAEPAGQPAAAKISESAKAAAAKAAETRVAAEKAVNTANEKQKKSKMDFDEAVKTLTEATNEVLRINVAETNAKNLTEALKVLHDDEKKLQSAVAEAQKTNEAALKAQAAVRQQAAQTVLPPVKALAFSNSLPLLLTEHGDGSIRAWHAETGQPVDTGNIAPKWELCRTIGDCRKVDSPLTGRVNALAFSPDGTLLASGSGDPSRSGEIKLWDPQTGMLVRDFVSPHKDSVMTLDFSSDGKLLASGSADKAVRIWETATGKMFRNFEAHAGHVLAVSFRYDMRRVVSAGADNSIKTWDLRTSDVLKTFSDFSKEVNSVHYIGRGDQLLSTSGAPVVRVIRDGGGDVRSKTEGFLKFLTASAVSRDGQTQAVGDVTGTLRIIAADGKIIAQWPPAAATLAAH